MEINGYNEQMSELKCDRCGRRLSVECFNINISCNRGYDYECKDCDTFFVYEDYTYYEDYISKPYPFKYKMNTYKSKYKSITHQEINNNSVEQIYRAASLLTILSKKQHVVDHIWPISKGGCHHQDNLQIITSVLNSSKRSKLHHNIPDAKSILDLPKDIYDYCASKYRETTTDQSELDNIINVLPN
jgi:5-methylcytosine-specific restriction endonuclease McrA